MQRYVLLPANLDIRSLIVRCPPEIPNFCLEKLLRIINLVYERTAYNKWEVHDGYVQIINGWFFTIADDYLLYVKYLRKVDVLLCDDHARPAKEFPENPKSYGYKFTPEYSSAISIFDLNTLSRGERLIQRISKTKSQFAEAKSKDSYTKLLQDYPFVRYLDDLEVDFPSAHQLLVKIANSVLSDKTLKEEERSKQLAKTIHHLVTINRFSGQPSRSVIIDKTGSRLHSPLVRLKKKLRYFITFKGERLVALDLKNSQPFFALIFLDPSFWLPIVQPTIDSKTLKGRRILAHPLIGRMYTDSNKLKHRLRKFLNVEDLYPEFAHFLWEDIPLPRAKSNGRRSGDSSLAQQLDASSPSSTLPEQEEARGGRNGAIDSILTVIALQNAGKQGLAEFRNHVANGTVYEQLIPALKNAIQNNSTLTKWILESEGLYWNEEPGNQRNIVKALMIRSMFSYTKSQRDITRLGNQVFRNTYPTIHALFSVLKREDHKVLARLLQRIESFVLLKACVRAINDEIRGGVPLWTIHDSIITTRKYKDQVSAIMQKTIEAYIGATPKISVEYWDQYKPEELQSFELDPEEQFEQDLESGTQGT